MSARAASPAPGRFVTLEGGEGAGKSTQCGLLAEALGRAGRPVLATREPGGAPGAELLRTLLLEGEHGFAPSAEVLLHFAARAEHVERTIRPALAAGMIVLCDRFADSTMAYQGYGQGADRGLIATLTGLVGLEPDLTLVLDVAVPVGFVRRAMRGIDPDRYERQDRAFHARVNAGFREIARREPERCVLIDAGAAPSDVHQAILAALRERLDLRV